ncbi:MAG: hypothetical protein GX589_09560 [Deltaproteobacteria bacterium]|nr:hypothetical protein [Deltaproteobacteria bacterium]
MKRLGVITCILAWLASDVQAGPYRKDGDSENGIYGRALNYMTEPNASTVNEKNLPLDQFLSGNKLFESRSRAGVIWRDWMARVPSKEGIERRPDDEPVGSNSEKSDIEPQEQTAYLQSFAPIQGKLMGLMGDGYRKAVEDGMKGPMAKQMIAFAQTEPGVFAGVQAAEKIVADNISLTYQAQNHMMNVLPEDEFSRSVALAAYNGCLQKKAKDLGWINAVNECMGDSNKVPVDKHKVSSVIAPDKDGGKAKNHPAADIDRTAAELKALAEKENSVTVLKILFGQTMKENKEQQAKIDSFVEAFLEWFGDYEIKFEGEQELEGNVDTTRIFKHTKVKPTKHIGEEVYKIILARYSDMTDLMAQYCHHSITKSSDGMSTSRVPTHNDATDNFFWVKPPDHGLGGFEKPKTLIKRLSIPEMPFQGVVINAVFDMFLMRRDRQDVKGQAEGWSNCLQIWGSDQGGNPEKITEKDDLLPLRSLLYDYGKFIAMDQVLRTFLEAEKTIVVQSGGGSSLTAHAKVAALDLIREVSQIDDIGEARVANVNEMVGFANEKIFAVRNQEAGQLGRALTTTIRDKGVNRQSAVN